MKVISKQITINITLVLYKVITIANKNFVIKNILVSVVSFYKTKKVSKSCLMSI